MPNAVHETSAVTATVFATRFQPDPPGAIISEEPECAWNAPEEPRVTASRCHETQTELASASRVAFPGQLSASIAEINLCLSQIKSEHIGDAARPGPDGKECAQLSEQGAMSVHPCPTISASAPHCNNSCTTAVRDGDVARRTRQRGQGIPVGSNRSAFQQMRFAMGSAAMSVDRECPLIEVFG
jgi:hypothetical protein